MAEPDNLILVLLRELRAEMKDRFDAVDRKSDAVDRKFDAADRRFDKMDARLDSMRHAINGESILGRMAVSEYDERPEAIERRLSHLESGH